MNAIMQEDVSGIRIIKACVREGYERLRFGKANGELVRTQLRILVIFAFMNPLTDALMYVTVTVILFAGFYEVGNGTGSPGTVMAALTYSTQMLNGILLVCRSPAYPSECIRRNRYPWWNPSFPQWCILSLNLQVINLIFALRWLFFYKQRLVIKL